MIHVIQVFRRELGQGIAVSDDQRLAQLLSIQKLHKAGGLQTEHEFLYRNLTILDDKSSALLSFNSIVLAATAILLSSAHSIARVSFLVTLLVIAVSSYLCLRVVWLHWSDADTLTDSERFWLDLLPVRDMRTRWYRAAWILAQCSIVSLVVSAVLDSFSL